MFLLFNGVFKAVVFAFSLRLNKSKVDIPLAAINVIGQII